MFQREQGAKIRNIHYALKRKYARTALLFTHFFKMIVQ